MNPANLQLEGILVALECVQRLLVEKCIIGVGEIDHALHKAEADLVGEERFTTLPPPNRDAILFPLRFLREALKSEETTIAALARRVGETKSLYNDQM